jgi:hypothetical protein
MEPSYREVRLDDLRSVGDLNPLDSDNSGRIERDEWNGMRTAFNRLDVNNDVALSRQEFSANDAVVAGSDDFDLLDTNSCHLARRMARRDPRVQPVRPQRGRRGDAARVLGCVFRRLLPGTPDRRKTRSSLTRASRGPIPASS